MVFAPLKVDPAELLDVMPYVFHVHAKFWDVTEDLVDPQIPWEPIVATLVEGGYRGSLSSEYEGDRSSFRASELLRRHQLMLRRVCEAARPSAVRA
jgi:sugar phosphate isomerase/epimerase